MNRQQLQTLSKERIQEAQLLLMNQKYSGAYYLAGYSVECALKAVIAKKTQADDFPDKNFVIKSHTHDLNALLQLADLEKTQKELADKNGIFATNWNLAKDWKETSRYDIIEEGRAKELIDSIVSPDNGILQWLKPYW